MIYMYIKYILINQSQCNDTLFKRALKILDQTEKQTHENSKIWGCYAFRFRV